MKKLNIITSMRIWGKKMNKKILIGSIMAVVILVLVTTTSAVNVNISGDNHPPDAPKITGPRFVCPGTHEWTFKAIDPDGDDVYYWIEWGEGSFEDWFGPFESGEEVICSHNYHKYGEVTIRAQAKDIHGAIGEMGILRVTIPKSKQIIIPLFLQWLDRFPLLNQTSKNFEIETLDNDSEIISYIHGTCDNIVFKSKGLIRHVEICSYWNHWLRVFEVIGLRYRYPAFQLYYIAPRYVVIPYFIGYSRPTPNSDTYVRGIALGDIEWS